LVTGGNFFFYLFSLGQGGWTFSFTSPTRITLGPAFGLSLLRGDIGFFWRFALGPDNLFFQRKYRLFLALCFRAGQFIFFSNQ